MSYGSSISFKNNLPHPLFIPFILENLTHIQKQRSVQLTPNIQPASTIITPFLFHIFEESSAVFFTIVPVLNCFLCHLSCSSVFCISCKMAIRSKKLDKFRLHFWLIASHEEADNVGCLGLSDG